MDRGFSAMSLDMEMIPIWLVVNAMEIPMEIPIYGEIVVEILWKNPSFPQAPGPPIGLDGPKARLTGQSRNGSTVHSQQLSQCPT
jgi:hypothetical protein